MLHTAKKQVQTGEQDNNPRAVIGNNNPPAALTPFEAVTIHLDDLYGEAMLWLDGEKVETQQQADALNTLMSRIREAADAVEEQRVKEKTSHDEAIKEIQDRYNPYLSNFFSKNKVSGKASRAVDAIKGALKPYLEELDRKKKEEADKAREEAARKQQQALEAMQARDPGNLAQREEAERLVDAAKEAETEARRAENSKARAKGEGRAIGLRTVYQAVMTNQSEASRWVWNNRKDELIAFVQSLADQAVRAGARNIPGFNIVEEKVL